MTLRAALAAGVLATVSVVGQSPAGSGLDLTALDRTVRPQDDLFRHANGRWLATVDIPTDRVTYGTFPEMAERIDANLRAIAEEAARASAPAGSPLRQIGDFYRSAMDEARLNALGVEPVRPQLDRFAAIRTREEFAFEAGRLTSLMAGGPFGNTIVVDAQDSTRLVVEIPQGGTMLPNRDAYLNTDTSSVELRQRYETYLHTALHAGGHARTRKRPGARCSGSRWRWRRASFPPSRAGLPRDRRRAGRWRNWPR